MDRAHLSERGKRGETRNGRVENGSRAQDTDRDVEDIRDEKCSGELCHLVEGEREFFFASEDSFFFSLGWLAEHFFYFRFLCKRFFFHSNKCPVKEEDEDKK